MNNIRQDRAARAEHIRMAHNLLDKNPRGLTAAQQRTYDAHMDSIGRFDDQIAAHDRERAGIADPGIQAAIAAYSAQRVPSNRLYDTYIRKGFGGMSDQEQIAIRNTMSTTTGSQGGFTVPTLVAQRIYDVQKQFSSMRSVCGSLVTTTGGPLTVPSSDGTAETGEILGQNITSTASDPSFGSVSLTTFKAEGHIITVPFELLADSAIDMEAFVELRSTSRIGRVSNTGFTVGDGSTAPQGVVGVATLGKVGQTGETLTIIADDVTDLFHSVDPAYRANAVWMASDSLLKALRKLKDSTGQPIYLNGDGTALPSLLGRPVWPNNDMPVPAANAKSLLFGDFSRYLIRDALDVQMYRFTDSVYTKLGQVGFQAVCRVGGNLTDVAAIKYFQHSAT